MPALGPATAALSDAELRETIDLHSGVLARMSDKIDEQGALQLTLIDTVIGGMEAILDAARAAKQQTDPARYARHIEQELDKTIGRVLDRLDVQHSNFEADRRDTACRLEELVLQEENVLQHLRADQERAGRWKKRIPFIALLGLALRPGGLAPPGLRWQADRRRQRVHCCAPWSNPATPLSSVIVSHVPDG